MQKSPKTPELRSRQFAGVGKGEPNEAVVTAHHLEDDVITDGLFRSEPPQVKRLLSGFALALDRDNISETDRMVARIVEP